MKRSEIYFECQSQLLVNVPDIWDFNTKKVVRSLVVRTVYMITDDNRASHALNI